LRRDEAGQLGGEGVRDLSVAVPVPVAVNVEPWRSKWVESITVMMNVPARTVASMSTRSALPNRCGVEVVTRTAPLPLLASAVIVATSDVVTLLGSPVMTLPAISSRFL
jgi:hypothetical protein